MWPDHDTLAKAISNETGLEFSGSGGVDEEGCRWIALSPSEHSQYHTFTIRTLIEWRRLGLAFEPGKFAGPLLEAMSEADETARAVFYSVLEDCRLNGSAVDIRLNGKVFSHDDPALWAEKWSRLEFGISRGNLEIGTDDGVPDDEIIREWTSRFVAAVFALLPVEELEQPDTYGFPEGALMKVEVNRYERDRRNRAAALAIHGCRCLACGMSFEERYGPVAAGFIEIHHVVPVSSLDESYVIDPKSDLVPLCSNCHSAVHRRTPPYSVNELQVLLKS